MRERPVIILLMFLGAVVALWCADVALNLAAMQTALRGGTVQAGLTDYLGLLIAETQVALGCVLAAWILAVPISRITKSRDTTKEAAALLSAMVASAQVVLGMHFSWRLQTGNVGVTLAAGAVAGAAIWACIRFFLTRWAAGPWSLGVLVPALLLPALAAGFGHSALARAVHGRWNYAAVDATAAVAALAAGVVVGRSRSARARRIARWLPVSAVVLLVFYSAARFSSFGAIDTRADATPRSDRPPIILIVLDTVRADHLRLYGYARDTMPALGRWAANATVFTRAVSTGGWTAPSHASIFSGLTVSQHGVHHDGGRDMSYTSPFQTVRWLPELLAAEGYYSLAVTANPFSIDFGVEGFDRVVMSRRDRWFDGTVGGVVDHFSPLLDDVNETFCWRLPYLDAKRIADITMRAVPADGRPLFLFVNMLDAHAPYNPPPEAIEKLRVNPGGAYRKPRAQHTLTHMVYGRQRTDLADLAALYDAELRWMDLQLERLLAWIDERYGTEAVVIVTSDHGEELGEEGRVGHEYGLPQRIVHVPLLVRSADVPVGRVDAVVNLRRLFDVMYLSGSGEKASLETFTRYGEHGVVCERYGHDLLDDLDRDYALPCVAVFEGGYKALGPSEYQFEVYDVTTRGFDNEIGVADFPGAERLRTRIDNYWDELQDDRQSADTKPTGDLEKQLRSLGYIK
jgi:hypothetical protein